MTLRGTTALSRGRVIERGDEHAVMLDGTGVGPYIRDRRHEPRPEREFAPGSWRFQVDQFGDRWPVTAVVTVEVEQ